MFKWLRSIFGKIRPRTGWSFRRTRRLASPGETSESAKRQMYMDSYSGNEWSPKSGLPYSPHAVIRSTLTKTPNKWGRSRLPCPQTEHRLSLWSILRKCCGKEFYRLSMPIEINEPLSFLQRLVEILEYSDLLEMAAAESSPLRRMQLVASFAVSSLSSNLERLRKPFNPILGETYELDRSRERNGCFRVICEQISHHPPISALYAESGLGTYEVECTVNPKLIFWGQTIEIKPHGLTLVRLLKQADETYEWSNVDCKLHNILIGEMYIEQCGEQIVECKENGLRCRIRYLSSKSTERMHDIEGEIVDDANHIVSHLSGNWTRGVYFSDVTKNPLWKVDPRPADSSKYYNFTSMAMALNDFAETPRTPRLKPSSLARPMDTPSVRPAYSSSSSLSSKRSYAKTDSRFRPDIRLLEEGDIEGAAREKSRLEEKQREARKARAAAGIEWKPLWFEPVSNDHWSCRRTFWQRKSNVVLPDLF